MRVKRWAALAAKLIGVTLGAILLMVWLFVSFILLYLSGKCLRTDLLKGLKNFDI